MPDVGTLLGGRTQIMLVQALSIIGAIVLVDLALSGDNALVIGAAASSLPKEQRRVAIIVGGFGAIVLRIALTIVAAFLLQVPLIQAIGGVILFIIAGRLLYEHYNPHAQKVAEADEKGQPRQRKLAGALLTIIVADLTMSLDNVLANAAVAVGHIPLLIAGLLLSIAIILAGSALVAALIDRLPWLLDLAALVLGWVGANMIINDTKINAWWPQTKPLDVPAIIVGLALVLALDILFRIISGTRQRDSHTA